MELFLTILHVVKDRGRLNLNNTVGTTNTSLISVLVKLSNLTESTWDN